MEHAAWPLCARRSLASNKICDYRDFALDHIRDNREYLPIPATNRPDGATPYMQLAMQMPHTPFRSAPHDRTDDFEAEFRLAEGAQDDEPAPIEADSSLSFWGVLGIAALAMIAGMLVVLVGFHPAIQWSPASCEVL